jgi:hypothetical protein
MDGTGSLRVVMRAAILRKDIFALAEENDAVQRGRAYQRSCSMMDCYHAK